MMGLKRSLSSTAPNQPAERRINIRAQARILEALDQEGTPEDLLQRAIEFSAEYVPHSIPTLMMRDREADSLTLAASGDLPTHFTAQINGLPLYSAGPACVAAVRRREPVYVPNIAEDSASSKIHDIALEAGMKAVWSIPLFAVRGEGQHAATVGTLDLYFADHKDAERQNANELIEVGHLVALIFDRYQTVKRSDRQSRLCPITDLPNRSSFTESLRHEVQAIQVKGTIDRRFGVAILDVDGFKDLNDALGFRVGDLLLRALGERLQSDLHTSDKLARSGSDSFFIMFDNLAPHGDIGAFAEKILQLVNEPYDFSGHGLYVSASMGISMFPWDGEDAETLMRNAETALDAAKERGGSHYQLFHPTMAENRPTMEHWFEQTKLGSELREALNRDQLELHYQPKVDAQDGSRIAGAEALLRWRHPELGMIWPSQFVPLAERMGLTVAFGEWALQQVCEQNQAWQSEGLLAIPISVNISPLHFRRGNLVETVRSSLRFSGLPPEYLELEIVEQLIMEDSRHNHSRLQDLHNLGIGLAVDDFGTGFSSLSYLGTFPLDTIKIDRSFVSEIGEGARRNQTTRNIIRAILSLARTLSLSVVAEGVETEAQGEFLADNGCDLLQGYYFSRPVPAQDFAELLRRQTEHRRQHSA